MGSRTVLATAIFPYSGYALVASRSSINNDLFNNVETKPGGEKSSVTVKYDRTMILFPLQYDGKSFDTISSYKEMNYIAPSLQILSDALNVNYSSSIHLRVVNGINVIIIIYKPTLSIQEAAIRAAGARTESVLNVDSATYINSVVQGINMWSNYNMTASSISTMQMQVPPEERDFVDSIAGEGSGLFGNLNSDVLSIKKMLPMEGNSQEEWVNRLDELTIKKSMKDTDDALMSQKMLDLISKGKVVHTGTIYKITPLVVDPEEVKEINKFIADFRRLVLDIVQNSDLNPVDPATSNYVMAEKARREDKKDKSSKEGSQAENDDPNTRDNGKSSNSQNAKITSQSDTAKKKIDKKGKANEAKGELDTDDLSDATAYIDKAFNDDASLNTAKDSRYAAKKYKGRKKDAKKASTKR